MTNPAPCIHLVTLDCKDADAAQQALGILTSQSRQDALDYGCASYDVGLVEGSDDRIRLIERWPDWAPLDRLLAEKVAPALPHYNAMLARDFDPARDTVRVRLVD